MADDLDILAASELFQGIKRDELMPLAPALHRRVYPKGSYLFHTDDPPTAAWIVVSGLVKICHQSVDGEEVVMGLFPPGRMIGQYWLLDDGGRRRYDAVAVEHSETVVIRREGFKYVLERRPALLRRVASAIIRELLAEVDKGTAMRSGAVATRLARQLLLLGVELGERHPDGIHLDFPLPQGLLAGMVGTTRENVNRGLQRLAGEGLVRSRGGRLVIVDADGLRVKAEGAE